MKKLLSKLIKKEKEYPYQNLSLADLPGEIWKDVKDFEGSYQVSTLGRIKSLDRQVFVNRNNGFYRFEVGCILRQQLSKGTVNSKGSSLTIRFKYGSKTFSYSIGRLVASHFLPDFIDSNAKIVIHKNLDIYDNRSSNLELIDKVDSSKYMLLTIGQKKQQNIMII